MRRNTLVSTTALLLGVAIGVVATVLAEDPDPGPPGGQVIDPDATFTAHRYEMVIFDSALDCTHAAGRTIVELHFPDAGIVCNVTDAPMQNVVMNAFYGEPRNVLDPEVLALLGDAAPKQTEPEVIEVPVKLYARIVMLANITRDRIDYATKLKADLVESGLFRKED